VRSPQFRTLALAAVLVACESPAPTVPLRDSPAQRGPALSLGVTSDEAAILEGAGIAILTPGAGEQGATGGVRYGAGDLLAFSAVRHQDGTVTGQFEWRGTILGTEYRLHGRVDCLIVASAQEAYFQGVVEQSNASFFPPRVIFEIYDQGEGTNDLPDFVGGPHTGGCGSNINATDVIAGNLQIRP
jgi:hypothetical protein